MPCFDNFPNEAKIIGRLLAGYGELELGLAKCLGAALTDERAAFKVLFQMAGAGETRLTVADTLMSRKFKKADLHDGYSHMLGGFRRCKQIRNQYAHCHWADHNEKGLAFADLDKAAKKSEPHLTWHYVDAPLLQQQEACFCYVLQWMVFLEREYRRRIGKLSTHDAIAPTIIELPNPHNPPRLC
jgi:hypothetical protein